MIAIGVATLLSVGVLVCHYYNGDEWDYIFGVAFFAGIPFVALMEEGLAPALWGYSLGVSLLIGLTLFAYLLEYQQKGEWEVGV